MLWISFLVICSIATVANLQSIEDKLREHGVNGWYVPQVYGNSKWMSIDEVKIQIGNYKKEFSEPEARASLNAVNFYLYTKTNTELPQEIKATNDSILQSNFNSTNPTRFTIHGWNSNYKDGVNYGVRRAWFKYGDYNMIAVDWARGRSLEYASSVSAVQGTGQKIATLIDFLVQEHGLSLKTLEIVGFSLGAHVAGLTAKQVTTGCVHKVVGLDPASPMVSYDKPEKRLFLDDAEYVESIHTNGGTLGFTQPIGRAAFYPNGGKGQPGCGMDINGSCAHKRAVSYYIESLFENNFPTIKCASYHTANAKSCGNHYSSVRMGDNGNHLIANGVYYVPVNEETPYGLGEVLSFI